MTKDKQLLEAAARAADLPQRLRENAELDGAEGCDPDVVALEMEAADRIEALEAALRCLSGMYSSAWDLVDGGLFMAAPSIPRFEEVHRQARIALGKSFVGDDGIDPDALCDPHQTEGKQDE